MSLTRQFVLLVLLLTLPVLSACDNTEVDGEAVGSVLAAFGVEMTDAANSGNGSDILVTFSRPGSEEGIAVYRILVAKAVDADSLELESANAIPASNYNSVDAGIGSLTLRSNSNDIDGDPIVEGEAYVAFVLSVADGIKRADNRLSTASAPVTLAQTNLVETLASGIPVGSGGVELDASGNIYLADFGETLNGGGTSLYRVTPGGQYSEFAGGLFGASGNAIDALGNIYQSNISVGTISKISPSGDVATFVSGGLSGPVGIAINATNELFVADCGGDTIHKVSPAGALSLVAGSALLDCPNGIALGPDGNLYVSNFSNGDVLQVTLSGATSIFATVPGGNNGHITAIPDGSGFYVVGRSAHRIYRLAMDGSLSVVAGSGQRGHDDGPALSSTFSFPNDLAVSPDGKTLYVNEVAPTNTPTTTISPTDLRIIRIEIDD